MMTKDTKHGTIIVDDADGDLLEVVYAYKNKRTCYAVGAGQSPKHIHRIIASRMVGRELTPQEHTDHANGNGLDNRRANIRIATRSENAANQTLSKRNTSGIKGVRWSEPNQKWRAQIKVNQKIHHLGYHTDPADAHRAYVEAARAYFGEFYNDGTGAK